jgi:hypothetical protein
LQHDRQQLSTDLVAVQADVELQDMSAAALQGRHAFLLLKKGMKPLGHDLNCAENTLL